MNTQDPKYQQKSKAISSAEPNYFVHFAMRHPVGGLVICTKPPTLACITIKELKWMPKSRAM